MNYRTNSGVKGEVKKKITWRSADWCFFLNLMTSISPKIQKVKMNPSTKNTPMHIMIKLFTSRDKEKILNSNRNEKHWTQMSKDNCDRFFLSETTQPRRQMKISLKFKKRISHLDSFIQQKYFSKIKTFSNIPKWNNWISISRPAL